MKSCTICHVHVSSVRAAFLNTALHKGAVVSSLTCTKPSSSWCRGKRLTVRGEIHHNLHPPHFNEEETWGNTNICSEEERHSNFKEKNSSWSVYLTEQPYNSSLGSRSVDALLKGSSIDLEEISYYLVRFQEPSVFGEEEKYISFLNEVVSKHGRACLLKGDHHHEASCIIIHERGQWSFEDAANHLHAAADSGTHHTIVTDAAMHIRSVLAQTFTQPPTSSNHAATDHHAVPSFTNLQLSCSLQLSLT